MKGGNLLRRECGDCATKQLTLQFRKARHTGFKRKTGNDF